MGCSGNYSDGVSNHEIISTAHVANYASVELVTFSGVFNDRPAVIAREKLADTW